ncbi:MAG: SUMF1/EgtB/PvdO family nonheme iron enzyme [Myxococcota bacterium]|nr:SUMF1/EgtB/PvdO family nonheme iron enzyme [Myxococcota bacterium]
MWFLWKLSLHTLIAANAAGLPAATTARAAEAGLERPVPGMACVPGGTFQRGSMEPRTCQQGEVRRIPRSKPNHRPVADITLQTYYMDLTEVTYEAYQSCVKAKKCRPSKPYYSDFSRPRQPMVGMSWYQANAYCRAMGKHLPTEAEWEMAARGPEGDAYPWGNEPVTCDRAVIKNRKGRSCGQKKRGGSAHKGRTLTVQSRPPGRYGLYDMIGNAEEWTADWYTRDWTQCGKACSGMNPKGPCASQAPDKPCKGYRRKSVRGGSWYWPQSCAKSWTRRPHFPSNKPYHHFGFRCAASLDEAAALMGEQK